jgi:uncharacterized protein
MSTSAVTAILDRVLAHYSVIDTVQFFGGEPLMNLTAIDAACAKLQVAAETGVLSKTPRFVATTNGTISTNAALQTLKKWNIAPTVSWDGPKTVHDEARPSVSGGSSFDKLVKSLTRFRDEGISYEIECTYSHHHDRYDLSVIDLLNFFYENSGLGDVPVDVEIGGQALLTLSQ